MYGEDSDPEMEDILGPIIDEFSIKKDVNLKKIEVVVPQQASKAKKKANVGAQAAGQSQPTEIQSFSYSNLKNNYLGRIQSPV